MGFLSIYMNRVSLVHWFFINLYESCISSSLVFYPSIWIVYFYFIGVLSICTKMKYHYHKVKYSKDSRPKIFGKSLINMSVRVQMDTTRTMKKTRKLATGLTGVGWDWLSEGKLRHFPVRCHLLELLSFLLLWPPSTCVFPSGPDSPHASFSNRARIGNPFTG